MSDPHLDLLKHLYEMRIKSEPDKYEKHMIDLIESAYRFGKIVGGKEVLVEQLEQLGRKTI